MNKKSTRWIWSALLCFTLALALPAARVLLLKAEPVPILGWQALVGSGFLLLSASQGLANLIVGLAGLGNLMFLIVPVCLLYFRRPAVICIAAFMHIVAMVLAASVPFLKLDAAPTVSIGYFFWLSAYLLLLIPLLKVITAEPAAT